jgi:predicted lipoprotein with Yx(FWY)xxD motif
MPLKRTPEDQGNVTSGRIRGSVAMLVLAIGCFTAAGLTSLALANTSPTLQTAHNSALGKTIVVDSHRLTIYQLSPETTHHLLCTKANGCFAFWPPVTVPSAKTKLTAGSGVKGKLGTLHRNGLFQLTLGGRPLYHFSADDSKAGRANGQGIHSFGGNWHVVAASGQQTAPPTTTTTSTTTSMYPTY